MKAILGCTLILLVLPACQQDGLAGQQNTPGYGTASDLDGLSGSEDEIWATSPDQGQDTSPPDDAGQGPDQGAPPDLPPAPDTGEPDAATYDNEADAEVIQEEFTRPEPEETFPDLEDFVQVQGQTDCLSWDLRVQSTDLNFKADRVFVLYTVRNICPLSMYLRSAHESDFLPVGIQKDGQPWIFLPDCPGVGPETAYTLEPNEGWQRGWFWEPEDHEQRVARCGVTYDPAATYTLVGYGLSPSLGEYSTLFELTEPIPLDLRDASQ